MQNSDKYDISSLCSCLGVSRSGFYRFFLGPQSSRKERKEFICSRIMAINAKDPLLGSPRITLLLHEEGIKTARSTVASYMRQLGISSATTRRKFRHKRSRLPMHGYPPLVNRVKGKTVTSTDVVWTTDITYIRTKMGWAYLSTIIDAFSKKVIAMRMDYSMSSSLCRDTLMDAVKSRGFPKNVIIHSDKGSQYRSKVFTRFAGEHSVIQSFTSIGHSCDENAAQESFHSTLKRECVHGGTFIDLEHARRVIFRWIEGYYNISRPHTALRGLTPLAFELKIKGEVFP